MFGIFRFILATCVIVAHIWNPSNGLSIIGGYAVYGFFILSGYLMTLVTNTKYGFTSSGIKKFLMNRGLRIYPTYWLSVAITLLLILLFGQLALSEFHPKLLLPSTPYDLFSNLFIFGLAKTGFLSLHSVILSPPAWALEIELTFYIFIGICLGKKRYFKPWLITTISLIVGLKLVFHVVSSFTGKAYGFSYGSLMYASLAFCLGALIFHYQEQIAQFKKKIPLPDIVLILGLSLTWIASLLWLRPISSTLGFLANTVIMFLFIIYLMSVQNRQLKPIDKTLGDLSYPMYLLHYQIAFIIFHVFTFTQAKSAELFAISFPIILLVSWLVVIGFESPISKLRHRVRGSHPT